MEGKKGWRPKAWPVKYASVSVATTAPMTVPTSRRPKSALEPCQWYSARRLPKPMPT